VPGDHAEWVAVNLESNHLINGVRLYPRDDGPNTGYGFPVDFTIQVSMDGVAWKTVLAQRNFPRPSDAQTFQFPLCQARFIRVNGTQLQANPNDGNLFAMQLAELEVTGPEVQPIRSGGSN
jgi:hypothetical protein